MKALSLILSMIYLSLCVVSCNSKERFNELKNRQFSIDDFFQKVASVELITSDEDIIYIDYEFDSDNKTINLLSSREKEPDFFMLHSEEEINKRVFDNSYEVFCNSEGDSTDNWVKTCDGKSSCSDVIYNCLKQIGCAKICKLKMAYAPQSRSFYLLN